VVSGVRILGTIESVVVEGKQIKFILQGGYYNFQAPFPFGGEARPVASLLNVTSPRRNRQITRPASRAPKATRHPDLLSSCLDSLLSTARHLRKAFNIKITKPNIGQMAISKTISNKTKL
jgi:hypothetical protein